MLRPNALEITGNFAALGNYNIREKFNNSKGLF